MIPLLKCRRTFWKHQRHQRKRGAHTRITLCQLAEICGSHGNETIKVRWQWYAGKYLNRVKEVEVLIKGRQGLTDYCSHWPYAKYCMGFFKLSAHIQCRTVAQPFATSGTVCVQMIWLADCSAGFHRQDSGDRKIVPP